MFASFHAVLSHRAFSITVFMAAGVRMTTERSSMSRMTDCSPCGNSPRTIGVNFSRENMSASASSWYKGATACPARFRTAEISAPFSAALPFLARSTNVPPGHTSNKLSWPPLERKRSTSVRCNAFIVLVPSQLPAWLVFDSNVIFSGFAI